MQIEQYTHNNGATAEVDDSPTATYDRRCERFAEQRAFYDRRWNRVANARLALFVTALVVAGLAIWQGSLPLFVVAGLLGVGFVAAVAYHTRLGQVRRRFDELWTINDEGRRRLCRDWNALPLRRMPPGDGVPGLAADLDLLGHASLQHLLGTVHTPVGQVTLERWLLEPAAPGSVRGRQVAVQELACSVDFRDELALRGRVVGDEQRNYELFLRWAEGESWFIKRRGLVWLTRLLPVAVFGLLLVHLAGLIAYPLWLLVVLLNAGLTHTIGRRVDAEIDQVSARQRVFRAYAELFELVTAQSFLAPRLQRVQTELGSSKENAGMQMRRLSRIMAMADLRHWLLYYPFQLLTLWDFHVLWFLERWQQAVGGQARVWLDALGALEALGALGALAHDHPAWSFPTIVEGPVTVLAAEQLAHPLLPPGQCVPNDVAIGPPGTFLLITGSNMSGKSTLLRAVGLNVVLAQAGGPVCAARMRLPPVALATSMRVQDSLERGVSYFMAELQRLKQVVDAAHTVGERGERTLLFLLDEILHGTNTAERQIAARRIIRHLLKAGAIGAVSTHDLRLADDPGLRPVTLPVYFTETFARGPDGLTMRFDYKLRRGLAKSTNALKLMEIVGLPLD